MRLEVEGEEVGGQILPHFYCEDMMNVMNKVKIVREMIMLMRRLLVFGNGDNKVFFLQERRREALSKFVGIIKVCYCYFPQCIVISWFRPI